MTTQERLEAGFAKLRALPEPRQLVLLERFDEEIEEEAVSAF